MLKMPSQMSWSSRRAACTRWKQWYQRRVRGEKMALTLCPRLSTRIVPSCRSLPTRTIHTSRLLSGHGNDKLAKIGDKEESVSPSVNAQNSPLRKDPEALNAHFDDLFKIASGAEDRGPERYERLTRESMARQPYFTGDFHTLEENHVLYGTMGTPDDPVTIESVFPTRLVGCEGSVQTELHELVWHNVRREKPTMCLHCGQVFQLVTPLDREIYPYDHH
eukprot:TRINITY_DN412_c0_g2_i2.p1 TRINITY_DN412_c0_g2~~TRINITY_DN412_c0_g2_i2.p1  ORF type:complete len:220 (+),score=30.29 TRINITY_DN412_c0_g2_i2:72-731(+)